MPVGKKKYYWDACIFIAWLTEDDHQPGAVMDGIEKVVAEVQANEAILITSFLTKSEVLECKLNPKARELFNKIFQRRNVQVAQGDRRVGDLAAEIRNHYEQRGASLSVPDSIHLASAIVYGADEFHTLDGAGKRKRKSDLLPLDGNVAGHNLRICVPEARQMSLLRASSPKQLPEVNRGEKK
jgi:predicted nucleic acid-binding protein